MLDMLKTPRTAAWAAVNDRGIYVVWVGFLWAMTLAGFLPDLGRYMGETPAPPLILHFHGAVYTVWLVLISVQVGLVERGKVALHKSLGWWVVGVTAVMVPLGLVAALVDMARQQGHKDYAPEFLALEFLSMLVLGLALWATTQMRRDPAAHKRLAMIMVVDMLDPGASRLYGLLVPGPPTSMIGWYLNYFLTNLTLIVAMVAWDLWKRRAVHPALAWGGALVVGEELLAMVLQFNASWHAAMVRLVAAWGWTG